jgi:hypothetical protein
MSRFPCRSGPTYHLRRHDPDYRGHWTSGLVVPALLTSWFSLGVGTHAEARFNINSAVAKHTIAADPHSCVCPLAQDII